MNREESGIKSTVKVDQSYKVFQFGSNLPKKEPNHDPKQIFFILKHSTLGCDLAPLFWKFEQM